MKKARLAAAALVAVAALVIWQGASAQQPPRPRAVPGGAATGTPELPQGHPPIDPARREALQKIIDEQRRKKALEQGGAVPPPPPMHKVKAPVDEEGHCIGGGPNDRPKDINLFHGWLGAKEELGESGEKWKKAVKPPPQKGSKEWWFWRLTPYPWRYANENDECDRDNEPVPLFANILNVAVLAFVLVRYGRKPVAEALQKRKKTIMAEFDKAAEIKRDARERLGRYEDELEHLDEKLVSLREQYAAEGEKEEERVRSHVAQRRDRMLADAEFRIVQEAKGARDDLSREALEAALAAAEQIVTRSVTAADHSRLAQEYLDQVSAVLLRNRRPFMSEMIAKRYARAVFDLAREQSTVAEVARELAAFADVHATSRDFRDVDHLPNLRDEERRAVVKAIGDKLGASELTIRTVTMLAIRQRLSILPDLVRVYEAMADEHLGILRGEVTSAVRLDEDYRAALKRKIEQATGKKVVLSFEEDASLIAGIVTQIGDRVIDGSIRGRLNKLAESLRQA